VTWPKRILLSGLFRECAGGYTRRMKVDERPPSAGGVMALIT